MHPVTRVVPSIEVGTTSTGDFVSHDHRIGKDFECVVQLTETFKAQQQAAELVFPGEQPLNGTEPLFEDCRIEQRLAASFGSFSTARIRVDIGNHVAIENGFAVQPAIVRAIETHDGIRSAVCSRSQRGGHGVEEYLEPKYVCFGNLG